MFLGSQECVSWHVVMVEKPIVVLSLCWTFAPNALSQPFHNHTVKLPINGFTRGYKFLVDIFLDVINMDLTLLLKIRHISCKLTRLLKPYLTITHRT